jgi:multidrug efflux pump subunit AcrA (membrane-fusion protein)
MVATITLRESKNTFTAKLTLVNGAADPATRLVGVTAQVDATEHVYWLRPGAFCQVTVPIGDARQGIVVPSLAVQPTEKGNVVYVVDDKNIAHAKVVQLGMHTADGGIELTRGVAAGDLMVVRGIEPLTDGAPVKISAKKTLDEALKPPPAGTDTSPLQDKGSGAGSDAAAGSDAGSGHHRKKAAP